MKKYISLKKPGKDYTRKIIIFIANSIAIVLLLVFAILSLTVWKGNIPDSIIGVAFSIAGFLLHFEKTCFENVNDALPWETFLRLAIRKKEITSQSDIRISYAAVMIIEVNGKYLLKLNSHGLGVYYLPARTYRLSIEKLQSLKEEFAVKEDAAIINKKYHDYRLLVEAKKLKKFYQRFLEDVDPNTYDYSSIIQDVISKEDGLGLDEELFKDLKIDFIGRKIRPIAYSSYFSVYEMLLADILVFRPNEEQYQALMEAMEKEHSNYRFETIDIIKTNGVNLAIGKQKGDISPHVQEYLTFKQK